MSLKIGKQEVLWNSDKNCSDNQLICKIYGDKYRDDGKHKVNGFCVNRRIPKRPHRRRIWHYTSICRWKFLTSSKQPSKKHQGMSYSERLSEEELEFVGNCLFNCDEINEHWHYPLWTLLPATRWPITNIASIALRNRSKDNRVDTTVASLRRSNEENKQQNKLMPWQVYKMAKEEWMKYNITITWFERATWIFDGPRNSPRSWLSARGEAE